MLLFIFLLLIDISTSDKCYWNNLCPNLLFGTKTLYETVRGDIRDYTDPLNCEAVSIWSLHRHGESPPTNLRDPMKILLNKIQDQIIDSYDAGKSKLCAQDIDAIRVWRYNDTNLKEAVTSTGSEEMYGIGKRIRLRYPHLVRGSGDDYYFRTSPVPRVVDSGKAFLRGLTDGTSLNVTFDQLEDPYEIIVPMVNCERYQKEVMGGIITIQQLADFMNTDDYTAVLKSAQKRLGITYKLTRQDIYTLYDICRCHRSWVASRKNAWCAVFADEDLQVLEYGDDVRHYYRNGYGSWVNPRLAGPILKDLRERFQAAANGEGKKIVSYISHNTMTEIIFVALGLFKDPFPIVGSKRVADRLWRTSHFAVSSTNFIAVLNRCSVSGTQTHRVQFFINEKETDLCPLSGCSWEQFQEMLGGFEDNLNFCNLDYPEPKVLQAYMNAAVVQGSSSIVILAVVTIVKIANT